MFYKLVYDMNSIDELIKKGINKIDSFKSNVSQIEYPGIKKGHFDKIIFQNKNIKDWPEVKFYYSALASDMESDYLLNSNVWPIVHKRVKDTFDELSISGISYYPIKLVDVVIGRINNNYFLMHIQNFIEAYDMEKSKYTYYKEYNYYSFMPMTTYLDAKNKKYLYMYRER